MPWCSTGVTKDSLFAIWFGAEGMPKISPFDFPPSSWAMFLLRDVMTIGAGFVFPEIAKEWVLENNIIEDEVVADFTTQLAVRRRILSNASSLLDEPQSPRLLNVHRCRVCAKCSSLQSTSEPSIFTIVQALVWKTAQGTLQKHCSSVAPRERRAASCSRRDFTVFSCRYVRHVLMECAAARAVRVLVVYGFAGCVLT